MRYSVPVVLSRLMKARVGMFGVGVSGINNGLSRHYLASIVDRADVVVVRDKYSANEIIKIRPARTNIRVGVDLALSLDRESIIKAYGNPRQITRGVGLNVGLHLESLIRVGVNGYNFTKIILSELHKLRNCGVNVFIIIDHNSSVYEKYGSIMLEVGCEFPVVHNDNPWLLARELSGLDVVLTSKLHVGIVGYALGCAVFGVSTHEKTAAFYKLIGRGAYQASYQTAAEHVLSWVRDIGTRNADALNLGSEFRVDLRNKALGLLDEIEDFYSGES